MAEQREGRIAVFGDLSGHLRPVLDELEQLGVEFDGPYQLPNVVTSWPDDLTVVQVGDLVHKGPDSPAIVAVVHDLLLPTGRWVQLLGNHESQYVGGPLFWNPIVRPPVQQALREMWADGRMRPAAALDTVEWGPVLVTHGGLTPGRYDQGAGTTGTQADDADHVAAVAGWLNRAPHDDDAARAVFTPGLMAGRNGADPGVAWAEARAEVRVPWRRWQARGRVLDDAPDRRPLPFSQVHGHSTPLLWARGQRGRVPGDLETFTTVRDNGHVVSRYDVDGGPPRAIIGIDPGANARRRVAPKPLVVRGNVLT